MVAGAGHAIGSEQPKIFNAIVGRVLRSVDAGTTPRNSLVTPRNSLVTKQVVDRDISDTVHLAAQHEHDTAEHDQTLHSVTEYDQTQYDIGAQHDHGLHDRVLHDDVHHDHQRSQHVRQQPCESDCHEASSHMSTEQVHPDDQRQLSTGNYSTFIDSMANDVDHVEHYSNCTEDFLTEDTYCRTDVASLTRSSCSVASVQVPISGTPVVEESSAAIMRTLLYS